MSRGDVSLLSSPDPLALSTEKIAAPSPAKTRLAKAKAPTITPRKPLADTSGNGRVQDFIISTPPARRIGNSPTKSPVKIEPTSPWRIRLTVQAEQMEEKAQGTRRHNSPNKRLTEHTTTITVPLKGGDDTPSPVAKRGRGRPRKSLEGPKKRSGTPKPRADSRQKAIHDPRDGTISDTSRTATTPPKKARGRPRKSVNPEVPEFATDSLLLTPVADKGDSIVAGKRHARTRSKARRQEITPLRRAKDPDVEDSLVFSGGIGVSNAIGKLPDTAAENSSREPSYCHSTYYPKLPTSRSSSATRSPSDLVIERQSRNMEYSTIRLGGASPKPIDGASQGLDNMDPTNEHQEYDTILESEGFSMVSVESLASAGNRFNDSVKQRSTLENRNITPTLATSPLEPPVPRDTNLQTLSRHVDESREGTPKLTRVVRAGTALQGVVRPKEDTSLQLGSPFDRARKSSPLMPNKEEANQSSPVSRTDSSRQRLDGMFGGFGAGTRRELRAGLRLGEELAKRQQKFARGTGSGSATDDDVFAANSELHYPRLPAPSTQEGYNLNLPSSKDTAGGNVQDVSFSRDQLPTPERSEADVDEDRMSWKANTPTKPDAMADSTAPPPSINIKETEESAIDYTMIAREAEWQREREAISRQIEMANQSQVIVIDSDEEGEGQDDGQKQGLDSGDEEDDIWRAEAYSSDLPRDVTLEISEPSQPEASKPRRSKLPSPWRRNNQIIYSDKPDHAEGGPLEQVENSQTNASIDRYESDSRLSEFIDTTFSQPGDSTSVLIARQLSPIKASKVETNYEREESLDEASYVESFDDSTDALITRQLSPVKAVNGGYGSSDSSRKPDSNGTVVVATKTCISESTNETTTETSNLPVTPRNRYEEGPSEIFEGDSTVTSIKDQSVVKSSRALFEKSLGSAIGNTTASIDPHLLQPKKQAKAPQPKPEFAPRPPISIDPGTPVQTSWITRITAPIWNVLTPTAALPPPATKSDILCSSPHEPLCQLTPWEPCHTRALGPLYVSSLLYGAHIFPYNPNSRAAAYHGTTITTHFGWSRPITKRDCSVVDAFMVLLDERGYALGDAGEQWIDEGMAVGVCVDLWVAMVMRGEVEVYAERGERVGLRKQGDRMWTSGDIDWRKNESKYFERKRREFDGLPSWKAAGIKWPPA